MKGQHSLLYCLLPPIERMFDIMCKMKNENGCPLISFNDLQTIQNIIDKAKKEGEVQV